MDINAATLIFLLLCVAIPYPSAGETTVKNNTSHQRRQISPSSSSTLEFTANVVYNKLYQRSLNIHHARVTRIEPKEKLWFAVENGSIFAVPLFGDASGPFLIQFQPSSLNASADITPTIDLTLNFNFTPSSSLFYPSNHLLLALFNISSTNYNHSLLNRYYLVRTLSLALNLSESLLTIHKINGSMIKVYFSCDLYLSSNLTYQLNTLIDHYYSRRLQLLPLFSLPLIEISIVRVQKQSTTSTTTTTKIASFVELKKAEVTLRTRLLNGNSVSHNRTVTSLNNLLVLKQFYQPLVLVPLAIIAIGLFLCAVIACCLCCNRRSSSSSTLLLPTGESSSASPGNKHFYRNYPYRKHRQQYDLSKKKFHHHHHHDQRQFISKGIPVVFAEELDEKIEQTHTPLVMRIEKAPFNLEDQATGLEKTSL